MIKYRDGYKYQLAETYRLQIDISGISGGIAEDIVTEYILLSKDGMLTVMEGYAWDGPSGPTIDTPDSMEGSLVHDAGYQLMREGYLDRALYREKFDDLLKSICISKGMSHLRAQAWFSAVREVGDQFADPKNEKPVIEIA